MSSDEILGGEEAFYWHTVAKASELYDQFGPQVLIDILQYVNKRRCKGIGSCGSSISFPRPSSYQRNS